MFGFSIVGVAVDRMCGRAHHAVVMLGQHAGRAGYQRGLDQGFVALHVDHHVVCRPTPGPRRPRPGGRAAADVIGPGQQRLHAMAAGRPRRWMRRRPPPPPSGHRTGLRAAPRAPPSVRRLCRPMACFGSRVDASRAGDQGREAHGVSGLGAGAASPSTSVRASVSSITGMPSRMGKASRSAWQDSSTGTFARHREAVPTGPCTVGTPASVTSR